MDKINNDIKQLIGKKIRKIRVERKMSQMDIAVKAQLHRTYISEIENGKRNIAIESVESIAYALNVPIRDLFIFDD